MLNRTMAVEIPTWLYVHNLFTNYVYFSSKQIPQILYGTSVTAYCMHFIMSLCDTIKLFSCCFTCLVPAGTKFWHGYCT